jgi:hypothetical protein
MSLDVSWVMLIGKAFLLRMAQVLFAGFETGAGAALGTTAGYRVTADTGVCGVKGFGVSLARKQSFQIQKFKANVQMAAPIIAAGEVKGVQSLKVIQLIQVDGGVKIAIVSLQTRASVGSKVLGYLWLDSRASRYKSLWQKCRWLLQSLQLEK